MRIIFSFHLLVRISFIASVSLMLFLFHFSVSFSIEIEAIRVSFGFDRDISLLLGIISLMPLRLGKVL